MFVRVVEVKTKPGNAREVCSMLHEKVLSTLKAQTGFVDEIVLVSDAEGILALSGTHSRDYGRWERFSSASSVLTSALHRCWTA